jgi:methyl-accepting chemotaxis protein
MASIQQKVVMASLAIFLLSGGGAAVGIWSTSRLTDDGADVNRAAQVLRNHMQADMMHDALRADVLSALLASNPAAGIAIDDVKKDLAEHVASFRESISANKSLASDAAIQEALGKVEAPLLTYIDAATAMVDQASKEPKAAMKSLPDFQAQFSKLETAMEETGDSIEAVSQQVTTGSQATSGVISVLMKIILGVTILFALAVFLLSRKTVTQPIRSLAADMESLAGGNTDIDCTGIGRKDEIGAMAAAVEVFRKAAIDNKRLSEEAEAARVQGEKDRLSAQQDAEAAAAERLRTATSGLAAGLKQLAAGNLAFELDQAFATDFEPLRHDFNRSVQQLCDTLSAISIGISAIDDGTREISAGANDLSKRTEQQAASLEETAAALDEITANVSNSSKRTEEARAAATEANLSAAKSAEVVSHAEEAMQRIEASSQQISSIIGVIDEIAFQTNLLALNAGVEAARAGEAGKGFAVVAQEVRELAQRSAQAAKEIKGHIQKSSAEVDSGVKLVRETGIALQTIGEQIVGINKHMESIATSAREQSTGLAEVNTAVNSMDQTTQQNAAMVEQSTAASATLAMEAAKLREHVSQFKLRGAAPAAQSAALRQVARTMAEPVRHAAPARPAAPPRKVASSIGNAAVSQDSWEEF